MPILDAKIYLKSGAIVEFTTKSIESTKNGLGEWTQLKWENIDGESVLHSVKLDQIAAITYKERK